MTKRAGGLTEGRLLARNTVWSLLGNVLPLAVAVASIPFLIRGLGTERFGLLSVIWVVARYFSVFDLGLGRALTKLVAERLGRDDEDSIPDLVVTGLVIVAGLGALAALTLALASPWLVRDALNTPAGLASDGVNAFIVLSASLPFLIVSGALIGLLEAHQHFRAFSVIRMFTGSLTFAGPALVLLWSTSVAAAAAAIAASRMLAAFAYAAYCLKAFPLIPRRGRFRSGLVRPLIDFGGWFTISNVISPIMVYMDRFVIGAVLSLTAVAYYTTPYEAITRLSVFPAALASVLFPAFTTALASQERGLARLYGNGWKAVLLVVAPVVALIVLFAPEGLRIWIGPQFASHSSEVTRWLAIGALINSLARIPHALVQGAGRPDLIAKLHLAELPLYLLGLWWALHGFGIVGAAAAWTLRIVFDTLAFFWLGSRLVPVVARSSTRCVGAGSIVVFGTAMLALASDIRLKIVLGALVLMGALIVGTREARRLRWPILGGRGQMGEARK